jgi:hypothetical protein
VGLLLNLIHSSPPGSANVDRPPLPGGAVGPHPGRQDLVEVEAEGLHADPRRLDVVGVDASRGG